MPLPRCDSTNKRHGELLRAFFIFNDNIKKKIQAKLPENALSKELLIIIFTISTCILEKVYICRLEF